LVDALMDAGFKLLLANLAAIR